MRISRERVIFEMNRHNPPAARCQSGDTVIFETQDCFSGEVRTPEDTVSHIDFDRVNPATGPLFVEGAEPGDTLKVTIEQITLDDQGAAVASPGLGAFGTQIQQEETVIGKVSKDGTTTFNNIELPPRKMIGVIGTAPGGQGINTGTPDAHGGNLDTTLMAEGATLYLPVNVEGALLALGDMHSVMGDGEVMGSGMEIAGEAKLTVEVIKGTPLPLPLVENDEVIATLGSAETMEAASQLALDHMVDYLKSHYEMTLNEAGIFLSLCGDLIACQIVNPNKTMRVEIRKDILEKIQ